MLIGRATLGRHLWALHMTLLYLHPTNIRMNQTSSNQLSCSNQETIRFQQSCEGAFRFAAVVSTFILIIRVICSWLTTRSVAALQRRFPQLKAQPGKAAAATLAVNRACGGSA